MSRKRIALLYLGLAVLLTVATVLVLRSAGVSRAFVENLLAEVLVRSRFRLGDATLHLGDGTVTLDQFEISGEPGSDHDRPLIAVEHVKIDVDTNPLGNVGQVRRVVLDGPHLELDLSSGEFPNLSSILLAGGSDGAEDTAPPAIVIENGRVTLHFAPDAEPFDFTSVALELLPEATAEGEVASTAPPMVLSGSMLSPAGLPTTVRGAADFDRQQFRAVLEIEDFPLDASLVSRFSPALGDLLEATELSGRAEHLVLWMEYDGSLDPEDAFVAGVQLDLKDLKGVPPVFQYPLFAATTHISADTRDHGSLSFTLEDRGTRGDIDARGTITRCFESSPEARVELRARDLLASQELIDALSASPLLDRVLESFTPLSGRLDAHCQVDTTGKYATNPKASIDLELKGIDIDWNGIPLPDEIHEIPFPEVLIGARGHVHVRQHEVRIEALTFESCGTEFVVDGSVGTGPGEPVNFDVSCDDLPFGGTVRGAIETVLPEAAQYYEQFSPRGRTGLHLSLHSVQGKPDLDVRLKLLPRGASASYFEFPVRIDDLHGVIEIEPNGVSFDLTGVRQAADHRNSGDPARADLHGRFFMPDAVAAEPGLLGTELWIRLAETEIDNEVKTAVTALGPEFEELWDFISPSGRAGVEFTMWRQEDANELSYDLRIDTADAQAHLESLPLPIHRIRGPIFVHGHGDEARIDLGIVNGEIANSSSGPAATLTAEGSILSGGEIGLAIDVVSVLGNLELNDRLRDALDGQGMFPQETWNVLRPEGHVDVISRQRQTRHDAAITNDIDITLRGVGSRAKMLPGPASDLYGQVRLRDDIATFDNVEGRIASTAVSCSAGRMYHSESASHIDVTVDCEAFPLDDDIANLFTGPLKKTFFERNIRGVLDVDQLRLQFEFPDTEEAAFALELGGRLDVRETAMTLGTRIERMVASIRVDESRIDQDGGQLVGEIKNCGFTATGHRVHGSNMRFLADHERLDLFGIRGRVHDGNVFGIGLDVDDAGNSPDLRYDFAGAGRLTAALGWRDVSLSTALRASGFQGNEYRGNLSGELRLEELLGIDLIHARGHGHVEIIEGSLGEVPMFTAIYSHLAPNRRPRFDSVSMQFDFADRLVNVPEVVARSPMLTVSGRGNVTMGGYIDMILDFANLFGTDADWLVLPRIARFLTTGALQFQIYGYLRDPIAAPQWLWQSKADKVPLGPIPARER